MQKHTHNWLPLDAHLIGRLYDCRYEEDRAARLIEEVMRAHVVRRVLRRRQRARRKAALEERQKKVPSL